MRRFLTLSCLVLALPAAVRAQGERVTLAGDRVAVYNLVGNLRVEPGSGDVVVEVTREGAQAAQLRLAQGEIDGRSTLRVVYPGDRIRGLERGSSTELRVRDDGTFGDDGDEWDEGRRDHERHGPRHRDGWREGRRVTIGDRDEGLDARADLLVRVPRGSRVALHLAVGAISVTNVDGSLVIDGSSTSVTTTGTKGALRVDVGAGRVQVSQAEGTLDVDTGSGDVDVSQFHGRDLSVDTGSGDVTGGNLAADELNVDTGSGDIRLTAVASPRVSFQTGSGVVDADLQRDVTNLSAETGSGDIAIRAPASLGASVEIETASGEIETDFPLAVTKQARDHVVGTIGDGQGTISLETGSGGIRLLKRPN